MRETGPTVYSLYPRRLERLTICRCHYKGSTSSSVIWRPWVIVLPRFEPATSRTAVWCSTNSANRPAVEGCTRRKWKEPFFPPLYGTWCFLFLTFESLPSCMLQIKSCFKFVLSGYAVLKHNLRGNRDTWLYTEFKTTGLRKNGNSERVHEGIITNNYRIMKAWVVNI